MKNGDKARVLPPQPVEGMIVDTRYCAEHECLEHCIEWVGVDGGSHHRWFLDKELELVQERAA